MNYAGLLSQLLNREDLSHDDMRELVQQIMGGQLTSAQIAGVLIALRMKGETVVEIAAAARALAVEILKVCAPSPPVPQVSIK